MIELTQQMRKRPPTTAQPIGAWIDQYQVIRRLGSGGGGDVYEAMDVRSGSGVALKILRADWVGEPARVQSFFEEAYTVSGLEHPGVIRVHRWGHSQAGVPFIAMELLRGEPLHARLARGRLPVRSALHLLHEMLVALEAVHDAGIVHCDLKPGNVFISVAPDSSWRPKILDFGLASSRSRRKREARVCGTPAYMAPERLRGHPCGVRGDLFAVGAMAYEMVSGRVPFGHEPPDILEASSRSLAAADPERPELSAWIARLLSTQAWRRPSSASSALRALKAVSRTRSLQSRTIGTLAQVAQPV